MPTQDDVKLEVREREGVSSSRSIAETRLSPIVRHGMIAEAIAAYRLKWDGAEASGLDIVDVVRESADAVAGGNPEYISRALTSQAYSLDATITELMHRAWANAGEYPEAFQRYMNLALKAQSNCRTTLEALAKIHQPREQVVRHVHVYEGGQAVVAEEFHHHAQGAGNAGYAHQPHTPTGQIAGCSPLPSPDPIRQPLPSAEGARTAPLPNARRGKGKRGTSRKPERVQARP
jgi:hypothetical protein